MSAGGGVVVLGYGPQPLDFFKTITKACGKDAVIDPDVARMAGANLAGGAPEALAALRARLEAGSLQDVRNAAPSLSQAAARWLANGARGASSNAIFTHLTGIQAGDGSYADRHPYDPADFRRCRLLLEQVPELGPLFSKMGDVSKQWAWLVHDWPEICFAMDTECPDWRDQRSGASAPKTYQLIKQAIGR